MKITIAIDSLKGSLTSLEAGRGVEDGIKRVYPEAEIKVLPIADGGEGTAEALVYSMNGRWETVSVKDPLGREISARYGKIEKKKLAVMEMASAAGLTFLKPNERNPLKATTFGVGQMIRDAIQKGCRNFLFGIGGSATNDGGAGMLAALGYELLDKEGKQIRQGVEGLAQLYRIETKHVIPELSECTFRIACDVTNPLCGENGCSAVFGPQKGADPEMVRQMDGWLEHFAKLTEEIRPAITREHPGAGAAGGLGFAFLAYTNAKLESGIDMVLQESGVEAHIRESDFVITGEGKLDEQTAMGKAPIGVAGLAKLYNKPVIAFSGAAGENAKICNEKGIDAFFPIVRKPVSAEEAMDTENAKKNMADTAEQVFRLIRAVRKQ